MTIKQQGGVFGRHPEFATLSVADDVFSVSDTGAQVNGLLRVNSGANDLPLLVQSTDATAYMGFKDNTTTADMSVLVGASGDNLMALAKSRFRLYNDGQQSVQVETNGNFNVMRGNLIIGTSGKGIDFSATSGTGTSELFDDYEEGTWTPVFTASTTDPTFASYPVRSAHYRKIGAMVFVTARFRTSGYNSDGVGNLRISGLPYAAKSSGSFFDTGGIIIHSVQNWGSIPSNGVVKPGDAFISLIGSTGFVDQSVLALGTGTNNNDISFSGMYVTD